MIKRKMDAYLDAHSHSTKKALLVTGARQIGKTFSIREAGKRNFEHFVEINFITSPEAVGIFQGAKDVHEMLFRLSAFVNVPLVKGKTICLYICLCSWKRKRCWTWHIASICPT